MSVVWIVAAALVAAIILFWVSRPNATPPANQPFLTVESLSGPDHSALPAGATAVLVAGSAFSLTLRSSGGSPPISWSIPSGSLPPGLSLDSQRGVIEGAPSTPGLFNFRAMASDSAGHRADRPIAIQVEAPAKPESKAPSAVATNQPPCQTARFVLDQYGDALSGELIWNGSLPGGGPLNIQNRIASTGRVSGDVLPKGVPIRVFVSPATVRRAAAPSAANCWNSALVLQNAGAAASEIRIKWEVFQP